MCGCYRFPCALCWASPFGQPICTHLNALTPGLDGNKKAAKGSTRQLTYILCFTGSLTPRCAPRPVLPRGTAQSGHPEIASRLQHRSLCASCICFLSSPAIRQHVFVLLIGGKGSQRFGGAGNGLLCFSQQDKIA